METTHSFSQLRVTRINMLEEAVNRFTTDKLVLGEDPSLDLLDSLREPAESGITLYFFIDLS